MARKLLRGCSTPEVDEADGWVLRRAGDEEVVCDWRDGVAVDDGAEVEGGGWGEGFSRVDFEGVVVAGAQKSGGVEGVEGEVGDAVVFGAEGCGGKRAVGEVGAGCVGGGRLWLGGFKVP